MSDDADMHDVHDDAEANTTPGPIDFALLAQDPDPNVRRGLASSQETPLDVLCRLAQDPEDRVRENVARNHRTPPEVLENLAGDATLWVQCLVAENPNTPTSCLVALAAIDSPGIRASLAANPNTPSGILEQLASMALQDEGAMRFDGKQALARNPSTPADFLRLFATGDADMRSMVARNPSAPLDLLTALSKDKSKSVREAVAENPSAPNSLKAAAAALTASERTKRPTVAERSERIWHEDLDAASLASHLSDKAMGIRIAAAIRGTELGLIEPVQCVELLNKEATGRGASQLLARWEDTKEDIVLDTLLAGRFEDQLTRIAQDPSTPVSVMRRLFDANIPGVAWYFATRDGVTPDELHALSKASSHSFGIWTEPETLAVGQIYSDGYITCHPQVVVALHDSTRQDTLIQLRKARSKYVRAALAQRPDVDALPLLAKDRESVVRAAVAAQPATPVELLEVLAMDPEREVRAAVHANPSTTDTARAAAALLGI